MAREIGLPTSTGQNHRKSPTATSTYPHTNGRYGWRVDSTRSPDE